MKEWSVYEFSKFLYKSFGNPNDEVKEDKISKELKEFKLKAFPPIESLKFDYIELQTEYSRWTLSSSVQSSGPSFPFEQR